MSTALPPLGRSDHNLVHLLPRYRPLVQRERPKKVTVQQWTPEACEILQDCLDTTDWSVFTNNEQCVTPITDTVFSYINWCVDVIVPKKKIKIFPNNKPWVTKQVKGLLNQKKFAFKDKDKKKRKDVQKELTKELKNGRREYKNKIEDKFQTNNLRDIFEGINQMSGRKKGKSGQPVSTSVDYANELNTFYARFDRHDFKQQRTDLNHILGTASEQGQGVGIVIREWEVYQLLKKTNPNKGPGPDGVSPRVLNLCARQLYGIISLIFRMSISQCVIPSIWKTSCIIPIPKKYPIATMNDLRPIALTSYVMKLFEKIVLVQIQDHVLDFIDPLQFAYKKNRSVDDALLYLMNKVYSHLEQTNSSIRIMFFDFSSAFNTIQPHLLALKLMRMNVCSSTVKWILDYLSSRPQFVKLHKSIVSDVTHTNTGAPQGTVLSPFLFSLYTAECRASTESCIVEKYADDTALVGLIMNDDDSSYLQETDSFVDWCDANFLELNVSKTKEMLIDFRKDITTPPPTVINGKEIDRVTSYKYLGITLNSSLSWSESTDLLMKKLNTRMYCLRKLKSFDVNSQLLQLFYTSVIGSVLSFGLVCWGGNVSKTDKDRLDRVIRKAERVIGTEQHNMDTLYDRRVAAKLKAILKDETHPLRAELDSALIQRSGRFRPSKTRTERYRNSFIPSAIRHHNSNHKR